MSVQPLFDGHPEVLGGLVADLGGQLREPPAGAAPPGAESALAMARAIAELTTAGVALGFQRLDLLLVRGERQATVAVVRADAFLLAAVDPRRATPAEKVLETWQPGPAPRPGPPPVPRQPRPAQGDAPAPVSAPAPAGTFTPTATAAAAPAPVPASAGAPRHTPPPQMAPTPVAVRAFPGALPIAPRPPLDAWALLRRALVRGQLTEANARQRELDDASAGGGGRPGTEPLPASERERALRQLLDGIGCVLAGDGVGGGRILRELIDSGQRNLSFRWLALHWSVRAAIRSGAFPAAGAAVKEALAVAKQLDEEARAVTQCAIGEVLSYGKDPNHALPWWVEARSRFERLGEGWGVGQAAMGQSRVLALLGREQEAAEAARLACATDPAWDEPPVFLARRALIRGDLAAAEQLLQTYRTHAADRARAVIDAVRTGAVTQADAGEYLREHDAPASARAIRALERIARAAPGFAPARDALAWMLVKVGRYADAATIFRGLLARELSPADRASVMLGLGCIANADKAGQEPEAGLRAAVAVAASTPVPDLDAAAAPLPVLGSSSTLPAASGALGAGATVFAGELGAFALPDLLEFLRSGRRTGLLVCSARQGMAALRFSGGRITSAASPATARIGQLLVESRRISPEVLAGAAQALGPDPADQQLGEHLVREGLVDGAALEEALARQVGLAIKELLQWKDGEFAFDRDGAEPRSGSPVGVDVQGALLRVFQEQDEAARGTAPPA